ncbi:MAG TPA: DUF1491 family protein [Rhizomicrobium sp.]|nr:DUF1491 family protein [Rhizomicrobium sp.]
MALSGIARLIAPRLKAGIFVRALIRRAEVQGASAYVVKKGAEEAGAVFIKISRLDGTSDVLMQARRGEGDLVWMKTLAAADEDTARAYFDKQRKFDPDLWIVEIEDKQGRAFVDEPIV